MANAAGDRENTVETVKKDIQSSEAGSYYQRKQTISIVLPAYNEQENIAKSVEACREAFSEYFSGLEIIVVNDGSHDNTAAIIDELAAGCSDVFAIHHQGNRGYGAALCSGFNQASKELIFFTDSDLQFDLKEIKHLVKWIPVYDIVAGYRQRRADPYHRRLNAWGWNQLVRVVLGVNVKDIDCAFKLFHREVFEQIDIESAGAMINTEILYKARLNGMHLKEVPVSHFPRVAGEQTGANPKVILKAFRELFGLRGKLKQLKKGISVQNNNNCADKTAA